MTKGKDTYKCVTCSYNKDLCYQFFCSVYRFIVVEYFMIISRYICIYVYIYGIFLQLSSVLCASNITKYDHSYAYEIRSCTYLH